MEDKGIGPGQTGNAILDLIQADFSIVEDFRSCEVEIKKNQFLNKGAVRTDYIYFPKSTLISMRCDLVSGCTAEFGQIGREGIVGVTSLLGRNSMPSTAIALTSGTAYRVATPIILRAFEAFANFRRAILTYMQGHMQEAAQRIVCNQYHSIAEQLSRTLLLASDRLASPSMSLTHEQLAFAIGCRREAVSVAAGKLQSLNLIRYSYGQITILDRPGLEAYCCECYEVIRGGFADFLPKCPSELPRQMDTGAGND